MIKAVIFDCFGVIISDSLTVIVDELNKHDPAGAQEIKDLVRASNKGLIDSGDSNRRIAEILGMDVPGYQQRVRDGEVKDRRVLELIKQLHANYKTAMLSNISSTGVNRRFTPEEQSEYFDVIVASSVIGFAKPEARAYEITAERLGVQPDECVFIDDKESFCEAAEAVGMKSVWYRDFEQAKSDLEQVLKA